MMLKSEQYTESGLSDGFWFIGAKDILIAHLLLLLQVLNEVQRQSWGGYSTCKHQGQIGSQAPEEIMYKQFGNANCALRFGLWMCLCKY